MLGLGRKRTTPGALFDARWVQAARGNVQRANSVRIVHRAARVCIYAVEASRDRLAGLW